MTFRSAVIVLLFAAVVIVVFGPSADAGTVPITDGLVLHLDAADPFGNGGASLPTSGSALGTWHNLGSFGDSADAGATSGAEPTWYDSGSGPRDLPRINFDGTGDVLTADSAADWKFLHYDDAGNAFDGSTVFVLWQTTDANPNGLLGILSTGAASGTVVGYDLWYDDRSSKGLNDRARLLISDGGGGASTLDTGNVNDKFPGGEWGILTAMYALDAAGDDGRLFVDYALAASQETAAMPASGNPAYTLTIGDLGSRGYKLKGDIAEILIYDRELSAAEHNSVGFYLEHKYGLDTLYTPEPSALLMLALGTITWSLWRRKRSPCC